MSKPDLFTFDHAGEVIVAEISGRNYPGGYYRNGDPREPEFREVCIVSINGSQEEASRREDANALDDIREAAELHYDDMIAAAYEDRLEGRQD